LEHHEQANMSFKGGGLEVMQKKANIKDKYGGRWEGSQLV
jgi:hypothetical protein